MSRPRTLVVVAGTGTEVGKTWVACRLLESARARGLRVAARKPAQSFDPADLDAGRPTDADLLAGASGEAVHDVCPADRWYPLAMAPPMAADRLGRPPLRLADLLGASPWPEGVDLGLVETAGGVRSPIAHDGDGVDLARHVEPDVVVLVADAGLGTVNAVRSSVDALAPLPVVVLLNRFDGDDVLHVDNCAWLRGRDALDVVTDVDALAERLSGRAPAGPARDGPGGRR